MTAVQELLFKIVGDQGVGKTSIINRYVRGFFSKVYKSTIGVDFALRELKIGDCVVKLQLWDVAGQERFNTLTHVRKTLLSLILFPQIYYRNAVGALVVFDVTNRESFQNVESWKHDIDQKAFIEDGEEERPIPCLLVANKTDLPNHQITDADDLESFRREQGFVGLYNTSAKDNVNIDDAMTALVDKILADHSVRTTNGQDESYVFPQTEQAQAPERKQCC